MSAWHLSLVLLVLSGCAGFGKSMHEGPTPGTYVLEDVGRVTVGSGEEKKQRLLEEALAFRSEKNMNVEVVSAVSRDGELMNRVPWAQITFRCVGR